jgi:hypothetical protein
MTRLLIVGVPRSGTTWVGETLGATPGATYVNEPDGDHDPWAYRARHGFPAVPQLDPGATAPDLERLWAGAFAGGARPHDARARLARAVYARTSIDSRWEAWLGGRESVPLRAVRMLARPLGPRPGADPVVVKSVRTELALEWVAQRFTPTVLVVERHPLNVLASWVELGFVRDPREAEALAGVATRRWGVPIPDLHGSQLTRQAFTYAVRAGVVRDALARHPEWHAVTHESLCDDSAARFAALAERVGLRWDATTAARLAESDRPGAGYSTARRAAEQPERWRTRLTPAQVDEITAVLASVRHDLVQDPSWPRS